MTKNFFGVKFLPTNFIADYGSGDEKKYIIQESCECDPVTEIRSVIVLLKTKTFLLKKSVFEHLEECNWCHFNRIETPYNFWFLQSHCKHLRSTKGSVEMTVPT